VWTKKLVEYPEENEVERSERLLKLSLLVKLLGPQMGRSRHLAPELEERLRLLKQPIVAYWS